MQQLEVWFNSLQCSSPALNRNFPCSITTACFCIILYSSIAKVSGKGRISATAMALVATAGSMLNYTDQSVTLADKSFLLFETRKHKVENCSWLYVMKTQYILFMLYSSKGKSILSLKSKDYPISQPSLYPWKMQITDEWWDLVCVTVLQSQTF